MMPMVMNINLRMPVISGITAITRTMQANLK